MDLKKKKRGLKISLNRLKAEHLVILKELSYFEKSLDRIGSKLYAIKRFLNLFDNKLNLLIELEENSLFPFLEPYIGKDSIFVMNYTHDVIRYEFERLKKALSENDICNLNKSARRLANVLRFHITKEDMVVLNEAEKRIGNHYILQLA